MHQLSAWSFQHNPYGLAENRTKYDQLLSLSFSGNLCDTLVIIYVRANAI